MFMHALLAFDHMGLNITFFIEFLKCTATCMAMPYRQTVDNTLIMCNWLFIQVAGTECGRLHESMAKK